MNKSRNDIVKLSISVEELALALGLINSAELGRSILAGPYDNLTEEQVEQRLTTASHSLLARGLCSLSAQGQPVLDSDLENALFPLARYDSLFQLGILRDRVHSNTVIHVIKGKSFSSHFVQLGVVHTLEHGNDSQLPGYLLNILDEIGKGQSGSSKATKLRLQLGMLGSSLGAREKQDSVVEALVLSGWPKPDATKLAEDLEHQTMRCTLIRIKATSEMTVEATKEAPKATMLLLKGQERSWVFEFPSMDDAAEGTALLISRPDFEKALSAFVLG